MTDLGTTGSPVGKFAHTMSVAIIFTVAAIGIVVLMERWNNWWLSRVASRALNRAHHPERNAGPAPLEPESRFIVRSSEFEVACERPDGRVERVAWNDLQKVEVITTSEGPFAPDVFWVLHGTNGGCAVPQGATGEKELLERLQALPGFDNRALMEAMACTSDKSFVCWEKAMSASAKDPEGSAS